MRLDKKVVEKVSEVVYPIAEKFDSIQGEGVYTGRWTTFIRLVGCNVGRPNSGMAPYTKCTSYGGKDFMCDTNYSNTAFKATPKELVAESVANICITGGEPFLYDLEPLVDRARLAGRTITIETSGTRMLPQWLMDKRVAKKAWLTCSPKRGFIWEHATRFDEFKLVMSGLDDLDWIEKFIRRVRITLEEETRHAAVRIPIYPAFFLQPINDVNEINQESLKAVLQGVKSIPEARLSLQLHKLLEMP